MQNKNAYTLIELTVAIFIMLIIVVISSDFIVTGFKSTSFNVEQDEAVSHARASIENLSRDLREAKRSEKGDYPLLTIEEQNFVWFGDIDNDGDTEKIRYFLDGADFKRTVVEPGLDNNYNTEPATTTIATYINNIAIPLFEYYDESEATTTEINDIRMIKIRLRVNVTPARAPNDYDIMTFIQLRNLKDNL